MNKQLRNTINEIVEVIRKEFNIQCPITNFDKLVIDLGGEIRYSNEIQEAADATIQKIGDSFIITVSENDSYTRQRFSIAHE